jgi:hypothetical protein
MFASLREHDNEIIIYKIYFTYHKPTNFAISSQINTLTRQSNYSLTIDIFNLKINDTNMLFMLIINDIFSCILCLYLQRFQTDHQIPAWWLS